MITRAISRAKVVLTAIALTAAVLLVIVSSWPFKILVVLAFVRGLFASDVIALRNARRRASDARGHGPVWSVPPLA
jgi:hypothetical protein